MDTSDLRNIAREGSGMDGILCFKPVTRVSDNAYSYHYPY